MSDSLTPQFKVIMLGGSRVGKSSVLLNFVTGKFDEESQSTKVKSEYSKIIDVPVEDEETET